MTLLEESHCHRAAAKFTDMVSEGPSRLKMALVRAGVEVMRCSYDSLGKYQTKGRECGQLYVTVVNFIFWWTEFGGFDKP